jgi:hypothetical protein
MLQLALAIQFSIACQAWFYHKTLTFFQIAPYSDPIPAFGRPQR